MRKKNSIIIVLLLFTSCFVNEVKQRAEEVKLSTKEDFCALYDDELKKACEAPLEAANINWSAINSSVTMSDLSQGNIIKNALRFCQSSYPSHENHRFACEDSVKYAVNLYLKKSQKVGEKSETSSSAIHEGVGDDPEFSEESSNQMKRKSFGQ